MNESDIQNVIEEIELEKSNEKISAVRVFRSLLNQPDFVAINSTDKTDTSSSVGFSEFSINLPRPVLEAESIQLVSATIPTATQNIPDTACVFWYYRMSAYSGELPGVNNLHFVRLLPSYYKKEFIPNADIYGYNQTFNSYEDVAIQLAKACTADLGGTSQAIQSITLGPIEGQLFDSRFLPRDISITYDEASNKFFMTGNNVFNTPAYLDWDIGTSYAVGNRVVYEENGLQFSFQCQIANTGQEPSLTSTFWFVDNDEIINGWSEFFDYGVNRIVAYDTQLYQSLLQNNNREPNISPSFWKNITNEEGFVWNRYLIAGAKDPNVSKLQGSLDAPYEDSFLFEQNEVVDFDGTFYKAQLQTLGISPLAQPALWTPTSTPIQTIVSFQNLITIACDETLFATLNPGEPVFVVKTSNPIFNLYPADGFLAYANVYIFDSLLVGGIQVINDRNFTVDTVPQSGSGGLVCIEVPPNFGLASLSGQFDFVFNDVGNIPPQPFNPNPRRLLNSILGFTWDGIFTNAEFGASYSQNKPITARIKDVDFLNRLRPVPTYTLIPTLTLGSTLGSASVARTTGTYTADAYCNLVYSSTVQLYGSVVQGATLNSSTSTGLLGSVMLDAKNLGVSFFQEGFSSPLTIFGSDVYSVSFQLKDDFNDPYFLTNNAVIILVLKITYK
jgi:hypothetical protein